MPNEIKEGFRLSPTQERLWSLQRADDETPYCAQCSILLDGPLDAPALRSSIASVIDRYEILRTSFQSLEGTNLPVQVITDNHSFSVDEYDFGCLDEQKKDAEIARLVEKIRRESLYFMDGVSVRVALARLAADKHVLILSLPSLCSDRAGLNNLVREISRAYQSFLHGDELPEEPLQYADISEWQNVLLESAETETGREFWRHKDYSSLLDVNLPGEKASAGDSAFAPEVLTFILDGETTAKIKSLRSQPAAILLASWQTLLWRFTGQAEVVIGVGHDCRRYEQLNEALGLFVRYIPIYSDLNPRASFMQIVGQCEETMREAGQWQDYFTLPVAAAGQRAFAFGFEYASGLPTFYAAGVRFGTLAEQIYTEPFKLKLNCRENEAEYLLEVQYDAAKIERAEAERLGRGYVQLVRSAVRETEAEIRRLEIMDDSERQQVLVEWNRTSSTYSPEICIHRLFEAQAERTPERIAVVYEGEQMNYGELNRKANQLAHYLREKGVGPEVFAGIMMERSIEMVIALLGVLKAGGAYVPLDPDYPRERLRFMLADAQPAVLLTQQQLMASLGEDESSDWRGELLCIDAEQNRIAECAEQNVEVAVTPQHLAYVIYTSGSSGQPKGVMVSHRAIANRLLWMQQELPLLPSDRVLQKTAFSFDASIWEFFVPLMAGAQLELARPGGQQESGYLAAVIAERRITILQVVPTMLAVLLEEEEWPRCESLRRVYCGGERVSEKLRKRFYERVGECEFHNLYGPTEAAIDATHWECERESKRESVPIGRPLVNVETYVLGPELEAVPVGVTGELYIGGVGLGRGYWGRPELTAEKFIPHPHSAARGARLYRTGDMARYAADGAIEYLGRVDHQVKIRGFRIELGEVEAALRGHPGVQEAVVVARADETAHNRLVGYVVPRQERKRHLSEQPLHQLPNGLRVAHLNKNETEVIYKEIFEDFTYLRHGITLRDGDTVFDVGANIGLFSLFVHHVCRDAKVFAFEPIPSTVKQLKANVSLYDLNVRVFDCGLSNEAGSATFNFYPRMSAMSGRYTDELEDSEITRAFMSNQDARLNAYADELLEGRFQKEIYECQLRTISNVIREQGIERIDLLKIDAEKSELDVVQGIAESDWEKIKQVVVEVQDSEGRLEKIEQLLKKNGFHVVVEQDAILKNTKLYNVYATRVGRQVEISELEKVRQRIEAGRLLLEGRRGVGTDELKRYLKVRLPDYMIPSVFVFLSSLPVTPNGKLDRRALPAPDPARPEADDSYVAPRTSVEEVLASIWAQILGVNRIGIHENFFNLGGDSILSIQVIARANQAGLRLTPTQLFAHQTIAELASVARMADASPAEQGLVTGPLPLTPAQHWFFEQDIPERHHWNQALLSESREKLDVALVKVAVQQILAHHDALRLRFKRDETGWSQYNASVTEDAPLSCFDFSTLEQSAQRAAIEKTAAELQTSLNLSDGPLVRLALFNLGATQPDRLLIVAHHLVVDGVSWRILLEDFHTVYQQLSRNENVSLPPKTTSFKYWSQQLNQYAQSNELREELPYWLDPSRAVISSVPLDNQHGVNTKDSARSVTVALSVAETQALLQKVPKAFSTQINEVLLTAVAQAWTRWTGDRSILIAMEGHGREDILKDVDLSRTVGWFTTLFPVCLHLRNPSDTGDSLKSIKEQLRQVPNRGFGYGVLKYLCRDHKIRESLRSLPAAQISFNYLGQFDQVLPADSPFSPARESSGVGSSLQASRPHILEISGSVSGGRLHLGCIYSENLHQRDTIEHFVESFASALREIVTQSSLPRADGRTPSDFPLARLDQDKFDWLIANRPQFEDVYPLSPLQHGMLFHTVYSPGLGMYMEQVSCTLRGDFNLTAFKQSWQRVMDRHAILRTAFVWENLNEPLQTVSTNVELPIEQDDWRVLSPAAQHERWTEYLTADRERGFDPARSPLMRILLARTSDETLYCVWSFHHLLVDGWCISMMLREVFTFYEAFNQGLQVEMESCRPYRDYISWLQRQSLLPPEDFWRRTLKGFTAPTPLGGEHQTEHSSMDDLVSDRQEVHLSVETTNALQTFARQHQLTFYTLVQGAWALVLGQHSNKQDVVFGTVVSGRPVDLPGVETIIGPFINTIPLRVKIPPQASLLAWLKELQTQQVEARQHEHSPLVQVKGWSEVPPKLPLFESLLTFENRPSGFTAPPEQKPTLKISNLYHWNRNNLPLTMVVNPANRLTLQATYDGRRFQAALINQLLSRFKTALESMLARPDARLQDIELLSDAERAGLKEAETKREVTKFSRFKNIKPKFIEVEQPGLIRTSYFAPEQTLPLIIEPTFADVDPANWAANNRDFIDAELRRHGAILFRNFQLHSVADFESFAQGIHPELFSNYGDLPREETSSKVYQSTPYPADKAILFHNESSHLTRWPMKQWFYCVKAAEQGGETPIVDCRRVYNLLDPKLAARFATKQLMYVRNFTDGIDVSWQEFFKTTDRTAVEERCREAGMGFEWKDNGLKIRQVCQAVAKHPTTGETVFFNQIQLHHVSCLEPETRENILSLFEENDFPRNVYYGDGSVIEDAVVDEVRCVYERAAVRFAWHEGDVLMVDNMLVAHARAPFTGSRKIVVAMGQMMSNEHFG
ncbi:MAG TPA: amino acid adenylation domain-containing protein [Pyrinomonadaceae bacterium]|nr:amino acid adenylation domain-containing protein [Pyrinomonadaceae bacterium]